MRTLQTFLSILICLFVWSSQVCFAAEANGKKNGKAPEPETVVEVLQKGNETAQQDAASAKKDSEKARKAADIARQEASDAKLNAEKARMDAEKTQRDLDEAKRNADKSKIINISLFTVTNLAKDVGEKKPDDLSLVKPSDFKVESVADLVLRIKIWWHDISKWLTRQQLNIMILFCGVLLSLVLVAFLGRVVGKFILWRVKKHKYSEWGEQICKSLSRPFAFLIFTVGVFLSSLRLMNGLDEDMFATVVRTFMAVMAFAVTWGIYRLVEVVDHYLKLLSERSDNNLDNLLVGLISKALRFTIVFVAILFIGQAILGLRITALVAGAGIAGLAVALAAKDTLANFFGSVMIMLDKPFTVGERISIDTMSGTVEKIGFRSTRIRSLSGHMYSIPNSKLADSVVENIAKRPYIKYSFDLTLVYDTGVEKMERAMTILHEILDGHDGFNEDLPPRIYFTEFKDWALNISVILWFQCTDYFMVQQWKNDINLEILRRFNAEGLEFAFPTSTNYLVGDESRELKITEVKDQPVKK